MFKSFLRKIGLAMVLVGVAIFVVACDSGGPGSRGANQGATGANVDATLGIRSNNASDVGSAAHIAPTRDVISERLAYAEVNDELVYGYFVFPSDMVDPYAAIIVVHEWWGLNDDVRAMADRLAGEGYIVLAIDLYTGSSATSPEAARQLMLGATESRDSLDNNIRQAYDFVTTTAGAPRVASLGWDFGGDWALQTAMLLRDDIDAAVVYYGPVTDDEQELGLIDAPILALFGADDRTIRVESVQRFEASLERLRKDYTVHIYPDAGHGFASPGDNSYDEDIAEDAWQKTLEFLQLHLANADD